MPYYQYTGFGLNISSELALPELLPIEFNKADIIIREDKVPHSIEKSVITEGPGLTIGESEYLLKVLNIASYYVSNGNEILVEKLAEADEKSVRLFLLSNAMTAALYQSNIVSLQASGIFHQNGIILFTGKSGTGKSTLLAALQKKGYQVFTDDVCVLKPNHDGSIKLYAAYPMIKLWEDSFAKMNLETPGDELKIRADLPKYASFFHSRFNSQPQELQQLFLIENTFGDNVYSEALNPVQLFAELRNNVYKGLQMESMNKQELVFRSISQLIRKTTAYKIKRSTQGNTINDMVAFIESKLK
jgi:hypothetical protein